MKGRVKCIAAPGYCDFLSDREVDVPDGVFGAKTVKYIPGNEEDLFFGLAKILFDHHWQTRGELRRGHERFTIEVNGERVYDVSGSGDTFLIREKGRVW